MGVAFLVLLCFLLCLFFVTSKRKQSFDPKFSHTTTRNIRGLLALLVLLSHLATVLNLRKIDFLSFAIIDDLAFATVGGFFFLSSYGLMCSYKKRGTGYAYDIFLRKIPTLFLAQVGINLLCLLAFPHPREEPILVTLAELLNWDIFMGYARVNLYSWFITTILFFYFFLANNFLLASACKSKKTKGNIIFFLSIVEVACWTLFCFTTSPYNQVYCKSLFCFPLGILYALKENKIARKIQKNPFAFSSISLGLIGLIFVITPLDKNYVTQGFLSLLITLLLTLELVIFLEYFENQNILFSFLGTSSLFIYLDQYLFVNSLQPFIQKLPFIGCLTVFLLSLLFASIFERIYEKIILKPVAMISQHFYLHKPLLFFCSCRKQDKRLFDQSSHLYDSERIIESIG